MLAMLVVRVLVVLFWLLLVLVQRLVLVVKSTLLLVQVQVRPQAVLLTSMLVLVA